MTRAAQANTHSSRRSHGVASTLRVPWLRSATPAEILMCSVARSHLLRSEPAAFCRTGEPPPSRPDSLSIVPEPWPDGGRPPPGKSLSSVGTVGLRPRTCMAEPGRFAGRALGSTGAGMSGALRPGISTG
jgi:hypothetical protein